MILKISAPNWRKYWTEKIGKIVLIWGIKNVDHFLQLLTTFKLGNANHNQSDVRHFVSLSVCPSVHLLSVCTIYLSVSLTIDLSIWKNVLLSVFPFYCFSVCLYVHLSFSQSHLAVLFICLRLIWSLHSSVCVYAYVSVCFSIHMLLCLSICVSTRLFHHLSVNPFVCSTCLPSYLFVRPHPVCQSIFPSIGLFIRLLVCEVR